MAGRNRSSVAERGPTTDLVPLHQNDVGAGLGQEVGGAHPDHAATDDYDAMFSHGGGTRHRGAEWPWCSGGPFWVALVS